MTSTTPSLAKATFAGGCFWCMQTPFDNIAGVKKTVVGYTGGTTANPSYEQVCTGRTGHAEAIEITYDPGIVTYEALLKVFWRNIDPTTEDGQFADHGSQYRTAIFYHDAEQKRLAISSKEDLNRSGIFKQPVVTDIVPADIFYPAEEQHQSYYKKNPLHYKAYSYGSGRTPFLKSVWKDEATPS